MSQTSMVDNSIGSSQTNATGKESRPVVELGVKNPKSQMKTRFWQRPIKEIADDIGHGRLVLNPKWQREKIWEPKRKQKLIRNILLGLGMPLFYILVDELSVFDGKQRLSTIQDFIEGKFSVKVGNEWFTYQTLSPELQKTFDEYTLRGYDVTDASPKELTEFWHDLNDGGKRLTNAEDWNSRYRYTDQLTTVEGIYMTMGFPKLHQLRRDEKSQTSIKPYLTDLYGPKDIERMKPIEDIVDFIRCLMEGQVLPRNKSSGEVFFADDGFFADAKNLKHGQEMFRKTLKTIESILPKNSLGRFAERIHFSGLFLAVGLLVTNSHGGDVYYINPKGLGKELHAFLSNSMNKPNTRYYKACGLLTHNINGVESRRIRVEEIQKILLPHARVIDRPATLRERRSAWASEPHTCALCGEPIDSFEEMELHHYNVPRSKGGPTRKSNLRLVHGSKSSQKCNQHEGATTKN